MPTITPDNLDARRVLRVKTSSGEIRSLKSNGGVFGPREFVWPFTPEFGLPDIDGAWVLFVARDIDLANGKWVARTVGGAPALEMDAHGTPAITTSESWAPGVPVLDCTNGMFYADRDIPFPAAFGTTLAVTGNGTGTMTYNGPSPDIPTGGVVSTATIDGVDYRVHTFTENDDFITPVALDVEYFLVGAGGSGAAVGSGRSHEFACGGAGGRVRSGLGAPIPLVAGAYPIQVGRGKAPTVGGSSEDGGDSVFAGVVAEGGKGGNLSISGGDQGGTGGYVGGVGPGGGGAGDGGNGADGPSGAGGDGSYHNPDGIPRYFGGGGGGRDSGKGGLGGGSAGVNGAGAQSAPGTDGLGGGSGGSRGLCGKGGDGIVILRYPTSAINFGAGGENENHEAVRFIQRPTSVDVAIGNGTPTGNGNRRNRYGVWPVGQIPGQTVMFSRNYGLNVPIRNYTVEVNGSTLIRDENVGSGSSPVLTGTRFVVGGHSRGSLGINATARILMTALKVDGTPGTAEDRAKLLEWANSLKKGWVL